MVKLLGPETYAGTWTLKGERLAGTLDVRSGRRPVGLLIDATESWQSGGLPASFKPAGVLRGRLENGDEAVLVGTEMGVVWPGRTRMRAEMALIGREVPDDLLFGMAEFQVGGLTRLATVRPLREIWMPKSLDVDPRFLGVWDPESAQRWRSEDGDEVELKFTFSFGSHDHYGISLLTSPVMRVWGPPRSAADWLRQYVVPMAELITVATMRRRQIAWMKVGVKPIPDASGPLDVPVQVVSAEIEDHAAFDSEETDIRAGGLDTSLIRLGPGGANLAAVLSRWRDLRENHRTFHDYLVSLRTAPEVGMRAHLMAAVPALEVLHDQLHGPPPPGGDEQRRNEVLNRVYATLQDAPGRSPLTGEDLDFLERRLAPENGYRLAVRLATLADNYTSTDLRGCLSERIDPLPDVLALEGINGRQTAWEAMATVRNRVSHGDLRVPTSEQIAAVVRLAQTLATALALRLLDVPDIVLCSGIRNGWWRTV